MEFSNCRHAAESVLDGRAHNVAVVVALGADGEILAKGLNSPDMAGHLRACFPNAAVFSCWKDVDGEIQLDPPEFAASMASVPA